MTDRKKTMLGHKVRRVRQAQGLTQAQMAHDLEISASYLNLIERNQRPVTAQVLLKLAQSYDVDVRSFAIDDEGELITRYEHMFADPLFGGAQFRRQDLRDLAALSPEIGGAVEKLYANFCAQRDQMTDMDRGGKPDGERTDISLQAGDFFRQHSNYFERLETLASGLRKTAGLTQTHLFEGLSRHLGQDHDIEVRVLPGDVMAGLERRFDYHRRRLLISELLPAPARNFQICVQLALIGYRKELEEVSRGDRDLSDAARKLVRLGLANYFAGAVLLPYDQFLKAATEERYDFEILEARFQATAEQIRHRLTTLNRPKQRGLPLFFVRVDQAGNISKRLATGGLHIPNEGSLCPRWDLQRAFLASGRPAIQLVETPEGAKWVTVAHRIEKHAGGFAAPGRVHVIVLGCPADLASDWVYSDALDLSKAVPTPIGPTCRLCWREDCAWRAAPPPGGRISLDEHRRESSPYRILRAEGADAEGG